jgi:transcriptional regulator with XRE-family HTH domain
MTTGWFQTFEVGALLRAARHDARWSQKQLAAASGVSLRQISRYEAGQCRPRIDVFALLMSVMDHTVQVLDPAGRPLEPMLFDAELDDAGRHYPAAVDLRPVLEYGDWWLDRAPLSQVVRRPGWTYDRTRGRRGPLRLAWSDRDGWQPPWTEEREERERRRQALLAARHAASDRRWAVVDGMDDSDDWPDGFIDDPPSVARGDQPRGDQLGDGPGARGDEAEGG